MLAATTMEQAMWAATIVAPTTAETTTMEATMLDTAWMGQTWAETAVKPVSNNYHRSWIRSMHPRLKLFCPKPQATKTNLQKCRRVRFAAGWIFPSINWVHIGGFSKCCIASCRSLSQCKAYMQGYQSDDALLGLGYEAGRCSISVLVQCLVTNWKLVASCRFAGHVLLVDNTLSCWPVGFMTVASYAPPP